MISTPPSSCAIEDLLARFPRRRVPLPDAYARIYAKEYQLNRKGGTTVSRLVTRVESWMHRQIAGRSLLRQRILEIGAGTLNHLRYEPEAATYDVVEPFSALYENSQELDRTNAIFRDIADIPSTNRYDRIVSVAVLEHVEDLPTLLAFNGLLLGSEGLSQHAIPSEGAFLWGLGWRCTTAISYRARTGLDYARLMRWEHINNASEIECLVRHFFRDVSIVRFPIAVFHLSFYTCIEARHPLRERCLAHLQSKGFNVGDYVRTT